MKKNYITLHYVNKEGSKDLKRKYIFFKSSLLLHTELTNAFNSTYLPLAFTLP